MNGQTIFYLNQGYTLDLNFKKTKGYELITLKNERIIMYKKL